MEDDPKITFKEKEIEYLDLNHDNAFVVSMRMINAWVNKVMINTGNSIDIIYFDALQKLERPTNDFTIITSSLVTHLASRDYEPAHYIHI